MVIRICDNVCMNTCSMVLYSHDFVKDRGHHVHMWNTSHPSSSAESGPQLTFPRAASGTTYIYMLAPPPWDPISEPRKPRKPKKPKKPKKPRKPIRPRNPTEPTRPGPRSAGSRLGLPTGLTSLLIGRPGQGSGFRGSYGFSGLFGFSGLYGLSGLPFGIPPGRAESPESPKNPKSPKSPENP